MSTILFVGLALVFFAAGTWQGVGLRPDSAVYLGLWDDGRQQGPLYTLLIDIVAGTGVDVELVAWWINLTLLIATVILIHEELLRNGVRDNLAFFGVVAVILLPQFLYVHATVLSEPLFLLLFLVVLALTSRAMENQSYWLCFAAGLVAGLSILTRFSGVSIIGAAGLALLLYGAAPFGRRLAQSVLYGAVASITFIGWLLYDRTSGGKGVDRPFALLGEPDWGTFIRGMETTNTFFLPSFIPTVVSYALFTCIMIAMLWLALMVLRPDHSAGEEGTPAIARVAMLYIVTYIPFLILSLFIEYGLGVLSRYLIPPYLAACIALLTMYGRGGSFERHPIGSRIAVVILSALVLSNLVRGGYSAYNLATEGNYYQTAEWHESATLQRLSTIRPEVKIYSNGPDAIRLLLRRKAYFWPRYYDARTGKEHPDHPFEKEMKQIAEEVAAGKAVLVGFDAITWRAYLVEEEKLVEELGLNTMDAEGDGRIYGSETTRTSGS